MDAQPKKANEIKKDLPVNEVVKNTPSDIKAEVVINEQTKVRVVNRTVGSVVLFAPNFNGKRFVFPKKDSHLYIKLEELDDIMQTRGGESYLRDGIDVVNPQAREFLGLDVDLTNSLTPDKIKMLLSNQTTTERFERTLSALPASLRSRIVEEAILYELGDFDKADVIESYTGVKIIEAIALQRDLAKSKNK